MMTFPHTYYSTRESGVGTSVSYKRGGSFSFLDCFKIDYFFTALGTKDKSHCKTSTLSGGFKKLYRYFLTFWRTSAPRSGSIAAVTDMFHDMPSPPHSAKEENIYK